MINNIFNNYNNSFLINIHTLSILPFYVILLYHKAFLIIFFTF